jgi:hypothetical protein
MRRNRIGDPLLYGQPLGTCNHRCGNCAAAIVNKLWQESSGGQFGGRVCAAKSPLNFEIPAVLDLGLMLSLAATNETFIRPSSHRVMISISTN